MLLDRGDAFQYISPGKTSVTFEGRFPKKPELVEAHLTDELGTKGGDVCGGKVWIFLGPFGPGQ